MKRAARLQSAVHWVPAYKGQKMVRAYTRWFGVDLGSALKELEILGVTLDPNYVKQLRSPLAGPRRAISAAPAPPDIPEGHGIDWDDSFAHIAGFTSGGAPFGATWEEFDALEVADTPMQRPDRSDSGWTAAHASRSS